MIKTSTLCSAALLVGCTSTNVVTPNEATQKEKWKIKEHGLAISPLTSNKSYLSLRFEGKRYTLAVNYFHPNSLTCDGIGTKDPHPTWDTNGLKVKYRLIGCNKTDGGSISTYAPNAPKAYYYLVKATKSKDDILISQERFSTYGFIRAANGLNSPHM